MRTKTTSNPKSSGWLAKVSRVLIFTMLCSTFMHQGWYQPNEALAATVTYGMQTDAATNVGIDGTCNMTQTVAPTAKTTMITPVTTAATSYRPTTGMVNGTPVTLIRSYSPAYGSAQTITAPAGSFAIRGYNATDAWTFHVYKYNPAGAANNKTLMYSSDTTVSGTGATVNVVPTYTLVDSAMPAGWRLLVEVVYTPGGTTYTPRVYLDGTTNTAWSQLTVTETAVAGGNLTVGNGTNPGNGNVTQGSTGNAMNAFTLGMSSGSATVNTLTLTGGSAQFTSANVSAIKIYRDNGTAGTLDGADVLVATTTGWAANIATITFTSAESVTTTANYLVVVDVTSGATIGNTLSGRITAATGTGLGTPTYSDSASATLTIAAATGITSCAGCHGYTASFADGSARNTPAGAFPGSHTTHVVSYGKTCSVCHTAPATETSADFNHRNGVVQIANPINGLAGSTYSKASFTQVNSFTPGTCSKTYCHSNGTSVIAGSIPTNTSLAWGSSTNCGSCHGTVGDDGRPNYANNTPKRNTHGDGAGYGDTHKATACTVCHTGVSGSAGAYTVDPATHDNGAYNLQASLAYSQATGSCANPGCHGEAKWGGTLNLSCIGCHASVQTGTHGTPRDAVMSEFGLAYGHKKTGRGAVTDADCIVCHLEGVYATQSPSATLHKDGKIDLRDPDGAGETAITNISGGTFTFTKFATSYAAGSRTSTGQTSTNIDNVLTQKFCLACHDGNGATNTTARSGAGTAFMPWGGVNLGATYTVANGAAAAGGVVNVKGQFTTTNSSYHPVLGPLNRDFPAATRLVAPYNNNGSRAGTSGTKTNSVVLNCFDCHNTPTTPLTTRTVAAHGNAATLRGTIYAFGAVSTLCTTCHTGYTNASTHAAGSAWSATGSSHNVARNCQDCHGTYQTTSAAPARPIRAQDYHGNNALNGGGLWPTVNSRPYAFIRGWGGTAYHRPFRASEFTTGSATCGAGTCPSGGSGGQVGDGSVRTYTPGGSY
jgi:predicted CxxxxCH...CXXCH cytochrome family protein